MDAVCAKLKTNLEEVLFEITGRPCLSVDVEEVLKIEGRTDYHDDQDRIYLEIMVESVFKSPFCVVEIEKGTEDPEFKIVGHTRKIPIESKAILTIFEEDCPLKAKIKGQQCSVDAYRQHDPRVSYDRLKVFYNGYKLIDEDQSDINIYLWTMKKEGAEQYGDQPIIPQPKKSGFWVPIASVTTFVGKLRSLGNAITSLTQKLSGTKEKITLEQPQSKESIIMKKLQTTQSSERKLDDSFNIKVCSS